MIPSSARATPAATRMQCGTDLSRLFRRALRALAVLLLVTGATPSAARPPEPATSAAAHEIAAAAAAEAKDKGIPSIAVALVDRTGVIWSDAWGHQDAARQVPATPGTIFRAGSIGKLFTDIAIMRLVEQGRVALDAPVTRYLPDFQPANPFGATITLRQLMTHRSGLVREPPRGNYFDSHPKGEADAVASLNSTTLVAKPGTITKYSDAGIAVAGEVVARVTGRPFAEAVQSLVLAPLGMTDSGFARPSASSNVAFGHMASFDGGRWPAPTWDLGIAAADNLYTTTGDLGTAIAVMLGRGRLPNGRRLLDEASLAAVWHEQYPAIGPRRLGFAPGQVDGHATIGCGGAVYGHVTEIRFIPDAGVGVVVSAAVDSSPVTRRVADYALRSLLAARAGKPLPVWHRSVAISGDQAARLAGRYVDGSDSAWLRIFDDRLVLDAPEQAAELRRVGRDVVLDDAQTFDDQVAIAADGSSLSLGSRRFVRAAIGRRPAPPGAELASLIGEYGWDYSVLRIYQRDGKPYARIEWTDWLPLTRTGADRYAFPVDRGPYPRESLRFERDRNGKVVAALLGAIRFPRRDFGAEAQAAVRDGLVTGIASVRAAALKATPPAEPPSPRPSDLVAIRAVEPGIRLDIRYASTNNFMGQQIYEKADAFMQRPAAEALGRIHRALARQGLGLVIHDAYRPWFVTKMFWDATPPADHVFVADPAQGSRHNRGAAVDLTLFDLASGEPMIMTGRYDEFSSRSYSNYIGGSDEQRWLRETLRAAMRREDFTVYAQEWWHFDRIGWQSYPIGNQTFAALEHRGSQ